jgi:hypothetical protein
VTSSERRSISRVGQNVGRGSLVCEVIHKLIEATVGSCYHPCPGMAVPVFCDLYCTQLSVSGSRPNLKTLHHLPDLFSLHDPVHTIKRRTVTHHSHHQSITTITPPTTKPRTEFWQERRHIFTATPSPFSQFALSTSLITAIQKVMDCPSAERAVWRCIGLHPIAGSNLNTAVHSLFRGYSEAELSALYDLGELIEGGGVPFLVAALIQQCRLALACLRSGGRARFLTHWVCFDPFNEGIVPLSSMTDYSDVVTAQRDESACLGCHGIHDMANYITEQDVDQIDGKKPSLSEMNSLRVTTEEVLGAMFESDHASYDDALKHVAMPTITKLFANEMEALERAQDLLRQKKAAAVLAAAADVLAQQKAARLAEATDAERDLAEVLLGLLGTTSAADPTENVDVDVVDGDGEAGFFGVDESDSEVLSSPEAMVALALEDELGEILILGEDSELVS